MPTILVRHEDGDRFDITVRSHHVVVDQPGVGPGHDAGPTPTELFVAGLASCVGFYAERFLRRHDLPVEGLEVRCEYEMSEDAPSRVQRIGLEVVTPAPLTSGRLESLRRVVERCTVHNSIRLQPEITTDVSGGRLVA
jgi:putative redox protein